MMKRTIGVAVALTGAMLTGVAAQQTGGKAQVYKGLQIAVTGVERAGTASLKDCPPGSNTVNATTRPGEEFALVTVAIKVMPGFQPTPFKRPQVTDTAGMNYNTAATFVDVGSIPEYSCTFPFRLPQGRKLKSFQVDSASFDLTGMDSKTP